MEKKTGTVKRTVLTVAGALVLVAVIVCIAFFMRIPVSATPFEGVAVLPTYTKVDHSFVGGVFGILSGGHRGGCTSFCTTVEDGHVMTGRNMDLEITDKCSYLFKTRQEGLYETIGVAYFGFLGDDFDRVKKDGIQRWYYEIIPDFASDVMNSEGLYIENNLRYAEYDDDMELIWGCTGTNPGAKTRIASLTLPEYLCERCADIEEALELVGETDIYTFSGLGLYDNYSFLMADATGRCGILEIVDDRAIWNEGECINTNFYVSEGYRENAKFPCGVDRYRIVSEDLPGVKTGDDMKALVRKLSYFQSFFPDESVFDVRSEYVNEGDHWTYEYLTDEANREEVMAYINGQGDMARGKTREELVDIGIYFESVYSLTADLTDRSWDIWFREDPDTEYHFTFD